MWKKPVAIKQHKFTHMIPGEKVACTFLLEGCKLCRSFTEVWKSPSFCMTTSSVSLTHLSALLGHMIAVAAFADDYWHRSYYWYLRRSDCRNILIDQCAHEFAHSPALWHQPLFTNVTCAWIMRLCGINLPVLSFGKWRNGPIHDSFLHTNHGNPPLDQSFHRIRWNLPYERPNLSAISEMVRRRRSFRICEFKPRRTLCDLWWEDRNVYSLQLTFRHVWIEKTTKTFVLSPWHCHRKLLCSFRVFPMQFSPNTKQNTNKCFLHISHLKISGLHLSPTT